MLLLPAEPHMSKKVVTLQGVRESLMIVFLYVGSLIGED